MLRSNLRPIPASHPVVMVITLVTCGALLVLILRGIYQPPFMVSTAIFTFLMFLNAWSMRKRAEAWKAREGQLQIKR